MANEKFADVVLSEYIINDVVWVQDYHLMLLPSLLKQMVPKARGAGLTGRRESWPIVAGITRITV